MAARALPRARPRARPALDRPGRRELDAQLSFAAIPGTIERLLTGSSRGATLPLAGLPERAERVLFVYLDAFAWRFLEQHARHPLLERARADGLVLELESQFPSTTTAHTTTLNSGLPVGAHGVYEWHILEPSLDRIITPLMFSFAGDAVRETLASTDLTTDALFPSETQHVRLTAAGVRSVCVMPSSFAGSSTNRALLRGAEIVPARGAVDALTRACGALASSEPIHASVYLPTFDALMHRVGPDAPAAHAELVVLLDAVAGALPLVPTGTVVLIGTDHGMAPVSPARTAYVNVLWPELEQHLRRGADGKPLAPAGSCRDLFLHVLPGHVDELVVGLSERLAEVAEVVETRELLEDGAFGPEVSDAFLARLAEVVVLPRAGEAAWWLEPGRFEQQFFGQHGGRSPEEVEIPLLALVA
ncbi:MAG: alkaline phosphatase family protein [Gaiellaceae bacterium]